MKWSIVPLLVLLTSLTPALAAPLELKKGDHICLIGNTLPDRMQHHGWLETLLHSRFPRHQLVVRNLGFSGDELTLRLRSANFGSPDDWLTRCRADVLFAFFGYNESFAGPEGVEKFKKDLEDFIKHTLSQKYNGKSAPRLVLFSPLAHENLRDRNLPDGRANNKNIERYTRAMAEVARANKVPFVDLFHLSQDLYRRSPGPLTINGIHLSALGDQILAPRIESELFQEEAPSRDLSQLQKLRKAVLEKNLYWFQRYRTVDGFSIYGGRAELSFVDGQTNRVVMAREMEVLDVMTANRDRRIWAAARGKDLEVDDKNTPPFLTVKTNKPGSGPNGAHIFLGAEEAISKMTVAKGMKVSLFASEEQFPVLAKPVQMTFDTRGRLWVAAWPTYPHWKPKEEMDDKLLILEDTDGDGKADKCTVFADHLHCPTGFEFWNGGVLVAGAPDLLFLKDTDGDDKADVVERVVDGLDSADTHHTSNSFTLGPDGGLYFQEGTFHHSQVESPYGPPRRCANAGVFRYDPRRQKFDVYVSYGFANPHGHVFDRWGQDFVTDGTGNENYYAPPFSGRVVFPHKHPHMKTFFNQRVRPCPATEILSSKHFPEDMQGEYLDANVIGYQGILRYKIQEKESGFEAVEVGSLIHSSDPNFRPVDMKIGPDGALWFIDWQNPIIGHMQHNLRDPSRDRTHGRVYRITAEGRPLVKPAKIAGEPIDRLLDLLKSPEDRVRYRVRIELSGRDSDKVIAATRKWVEKLDKNDRDYEHHLLEALWVHQHHNVVNEELLRRVLHSPDHHARAAAARVLRWWGDRLDNALDLLKEAANDKHPRVRLQAVVAVSDFETPRAAEVALEVVKYPMDYYLEYALKETMTTLEPHWKPVVASGKPFAADNPSGSNYILSTVSTAALSRMARNAAVYHALLAREGVLPDYRQEALAGLARLNKTDEMTELLGAIERADRGEVGQSLGVLHDLAHLLVHQAHDGHHDHHAHHDMGEHLARLQKLAAHGHQPFTRQLAYAALITADNQVEKTWQAAAKSAGSLLDLIDAVPAIGDARLRNDLYPKIEPLLHGVPEPLAAQLENSKDVRGRYVRIELPGERRTLTLAEVQVFSDGRNIARQGKARQSSTAYGGEASRAIDGNTSGLYGAGSQTHTAENVPNPWWEVDLGAERPIESVVVWNRTEGPFAARLLGFRLVVLDAQRKPVFLKADNPGAVPNITITLQQDVAGRLRRAAMNALTFMEGHETDTFRTLAEFIKDGKERVAAVQAIRRIPRGKWPAADVRPLLGVLIAHLGKVPASERTEPAILDELQLGNDLAATLPRKDAREYRSKLGELGVTVVLIRTVPHRMVYDKTQFYVEAGKPVVIVLENADIMPHNLIVTAPGALEEIGQEAERMATDPDAYARSFIPKNPKVLHASRLLQPRETLRMKLIAPEKAGEYPYVCTFPGHWRVMRGTMHVVTKLADVVPDELQGQPSTEVQARPFVRNWTIDDLEPFLGQLDSGRSFENGRKMFTAASCVQCHTAGKEGGNVGPNLNDLAGKLAEKKMTRRDVLREMLQPSAVINDKFKTWQLETSKGELITGIILHEDDKVVRIVTNPQEKPREVKVKDIDEKRESKVSMMPEGLLTTLNKEEILDLMAYILSGGNPKDKAFRK